MLVVNLEPLSSLGRSDSAYALAKATEGTRDEVSELRTIFSPFFDLPPAKRFDLA